MCMLVYWKGIEALRRQNYIYMYECGRRKKINVFIVVEEDFRGQQMLNWIVVCKANDISVYSTSVTGKRSIYST